MILFNTVNRPIRILLILIFAYLVNRTMRLIVRRIVKNLSKQSSHDKIKNFKRRTGLSMLETSETPSGRSVQRAQTIGTAIKGVMTFVIVSATIFFTLSTYNEIQKLAPFGIDNQKPLFRFEDGWHLYNLRRLVWSW